MKYSASLTFMFNEVPFLDRFQAAADAGFDGVEIQQLPDIPLRDIAEARKSAGIEVALLNIGLGDLLQGGLGLSGVPGRQAQYAAELARALLAAEALGVQNLHIGPSRMGSFPRDKCLAIYLENVAATIDAAARLASPPRLLIEPVNKVDMPDALVASIESANCIREMLDWRVGLLFDCYHDAMNGADPAVTYALHRAKIDHVQFSNIPARREPGHGSLDLETILFALAAADYGGWLGAEYSPSTDTTMTLGWLRSARARTQLDRTPGVDAAEK